MEEKVRSLRKILEAIASQRGLRLAYDTHYDAGNLELSWWQEEIRHRLDFQPLHDEPLQVTYLLDTYPFFPKLLLWCRGYVPMFPVLPKVQWHILGSLPEPYTRESVEELILSVLPPNKSFKRDRPNRAAP